MFRRVNEALELNGMTRAELARELKLTPSALSMKLNGKANLTLREANAIKHILNIDLPLEEIFNEHLHNARLYGGVPQARRYSNMGQA
jgi:transcriptional regulator with XRE-family HTH domain